MFTLPPVSRPTIASKLKGKAKDTGESIRRSQRIAERTKRTTASESSTGKTILKHQIPGGLLIFQGTHPDYKEPEGALYAEIKDKLEEDKIEGLEISEQDLVVAAVEEIQDDPKILQEAKSRSNWPLWK